MSQQHRQEISTAVTRSQETTGAVSSEENSASTFVLCFVANTAGYRVHAEDCRAAIDKPTAKNHQYMFPQRFASIAEARAFADEDEQAKGGERANFRVCKCAKPASQQEADLTRAPLSTLEPLETV